MASLYSILLPRDAMHKRGLCCHAVSVCPSVCLSVTFVDHVKTNKHIFFHTEGGADTPTGTPLTGASNARGYDKMRIFFTNISLYRRNGYR